MPVLRVREGRGGVKRIKKQPRIIQTTDNEPSEIVQKKHGRPRKHKATSKNAVNKPDIEKLASARVDQPQSSKAVPDHYVSAVQVHCQIHISYTLVLYIV